MMLIPLCYMITCLIVFRFSTSLRLTPMWRANFYFLGFTLMSFGSGRFLYALDPHGLRNYEWLFTLAHMSLCLYAISFVFVALKEGFSFLGPRS